MSDEMQVKDIGRRLMKIAVSPHFIVEACKPGVRTTRVVKNPLPDDAIVAWAYTEGQGRLNVPQTVWLVIESESFKPVKEGEYIPELIAPMMERV